MLRNNGNSFIRSPEADHPADLTEVRRKEALLKTGALQSAIFNSANFSSIATDAKGVIQIFNVGAERMLGYFAADVVNKITPADISDPEEVIARAQELSIELETPIAPGFEALVFKASRGIEDIYELTYIRKDGSRFPAIVSVTALRDNAERIIGYLLIGTDNTARKQAEEALLKAGALQNAIFNSANFSSIATDAKGVIQIFNVGAERMLGFAAVDVINKITPADISDSQEVIARAEALSAELGTPIAPGFEALVFKASRGIEDIYELTYIRKDGSRFPAVVSVTALRDPHGKIIGYLLIGTDNTARKSIEAEQMQLGQRLRDQQFYTRSLFESNIDALMTTDPSGIITDVNKQMEALTGCTRDELMGAPFKNHFTDPARAEASIKQVLSKRKVSNYELTVRARDGKETVVSYNAATFYDRDRRLQGVFAAARDVTERKQVEEELKRSNAELEQFSYAISHDMRQPLRMISSYLQLLDTELAGQLDPEKRGYLNFAADGAKRLDQMLVGLLDYSRIGRKGEPRAWMESRAVLEEALLFLQPAIAEAQAVIRIKGDWPRILVSPDEMLRLLQNLIGNALKFRVEDRTPEIVVTSVSVGKEWRVCIADNGAGIIPDQIGRLFQVFQRLQSHPRYEGTGIGLALCRKIAEHHGGKIWAESAGEGLGSRFWLTMPQESGEGFAPSV